MPPHHIEFHHKVDVKQKKTSPNGFFFFYLTCPLCNFTHSVYFYTQFVILLWCGDFYCFVVREFLLQIYAPLNVKFADLKMYQSYLILVTNAANGVCGKFFQVRGIF